MAAGNMLTRIAIEAGFITPDEARRLGTTELKATAVVEAFAAKGLSDDQIAMLLACALQLPFVAIDRTQIPEETLTRIPLDVQHRYGVVPVRIDHGPLGETLYVAMRPERSAAVSKFLTSLLMVTVVPVAASGAAIQRFHDIRTGKRDVPSRLESPAEIDLDMPASPFEIGLVRQAGRAN